jgi:hypothetical protein
MRQSHACAPAVHRGGALSEDPFLILPDGAAQDRATDVLLAHRRPGVFGTRGTRDRFFSARPGPTWPPQQRDFHN